MHSLTQHITEANNKIHAAGSTVAFPHKGKMTTGKVVRYEKGGDKLAPHYVISHGETESAKVPPHKVEKYGIFNEGAEPKFERATKTDVHYTGTINGKTWVVPHAFHGSHDVLHGTKVTPMRHAIVTSPVHVQHNNPTLKPEEIARVHKHIKDVHGGQQAAPKYDSFGKLEEEFDYPDPAPTKKPTLDLLSKAKREKVKAERPMRKGAAERFMRRYAKLAEGEQKPVKGTPEYQAERDKYRHAALAASRKAATLAFARKHHIIKEAFAPGFLPKAGRGDIATYHQTQIAKKTLRMPDAMVGVMGGPNKDESRKHLKKMGWTDQQIHKHEHGQFAMNEGHQPNHPDPFGSTAAFNHYQKKGERMRSMANKWHVTDHLGKTHEVEAKDESEARKKVVSVGGVHPEGIPMTQWGKVKVAKKLEERTLTAAETDKKEELVHHMKKGIQGFKERYGKDAKSVMYATATKNAKRLAESEQLVELSDAAKNFVHHREEHWKHAKLNRHAQDRTAAKFHGNEMQAHFHKMTPSEKFRAHTGSWVSSPSKRLGGGSAKEDKQYVHESFMGTYTRNENANRHTANIVHLAKHFGTPADQAEAKFYADELKKHGHNKHHEAAYKLHEKLWPHAVAAHHMSEDAKFDANVQKGMHIAGRQILNDKEINKKFGHNVAKGMAMAKKDKPSHSQYRPSGPGTRAMYGEESEQLDELSQSTLRRYIVGAAKSKDKLSNLAHAELGMKRFGNYETVAKKNKRRTTGIKKAVGKLHEEEETMSTTKKVVKEVLAEMMTRKHFQQVADVIKAHPDAAKRSELAAHHASIFKAQNPRFDHKRFYAAANAGEPKV